MPIDYKSNIECSKIKNKIKKYSNLLSPNYDIMKLSSNKGRMSKLLKGVKIPFPKSYIVTSKEDIKKIKLDNKVVIKSVMEEKGEKVEYVESRKGLSKKLDERFRYGPQIVQEYINGFGCGFFALCDGGRVVQSFQHKRIRQYPESGGVSSVAESFYDKKLEKYGKEIIRKLKWSGVCMVEFICDYKNGKFYFIEFNPKFWGSLDLSIYCGVEFPYLLYKLANGEKIVNMEYEVGKRFRWILPEDTIRIKTSNKKWVATKEYFLEFFDKKTESDLGYVFNDPLPTLIRVVGTFYRLLTK